MDRVRSGASRKRGDERCVLLGREGAKGEQPTLTQRL
jgi:hypothetical protein